LGKGISVYGGMKYSLKDNMDYIIKAKELGFTTIFTSLHIPEANYEKAVEEFKEIAKLSKTLRMNITADISPRAFKYLGADMNNLEAIKNLGVNCVRVDFGFSASEIALFTQNPFGLKIEINASTVTNKFLQELESFVPDYSKLQACHNYYPRMNTGISIETFKRKNAMLSKYGMKLSAFIPSLVNKRGPIFEGLPTLELHRELNPSTAVKHLFALGIDNVVFGDSIPSLQELEEVGRLKEGVIELLVEPYMPSVIERSIMFNNIHENRPDSAEDVIRSTISRESLNKDDIITPNNCVAREKGQITIDNLKYLRYCGELQICKKALRSDKRVNVVGKIIEEELFLLDYIEDETKFRLKEK